MKSNKVENNNVSVKVRECPEIVPSCLPGRKEEEGSRMMGPLLPPTAREVFSSPSDRGTGSRVTEPASLLRKFSPPPDRGTGSRVTGPASPLRKIFLTEFGERTPGDGVCFPIFGNSCWGRKSDSRVTGSDFPDLCPWAGNRLTVDGVDPGLFLFPPPLERPESSLRPVCLEI